MKKSGFTLIELLVAVTIIAILATIGLVLFSGVQKQARIGKRVQDLHAIQAALELYYQANQSYPLSNDWTQCNPVMTQLVPTYMPTFPSDPHSSGCYDYRSSSSGADYKLRDSCPGSSCDMTAADYATQKNLIDPAMDGGGECRAVDGTNYKAWAVYSNNTGANDSVNNPACW